jgi:hypothetical protein
MKMVLFCHLLGHGDDGAYFDGKKKRRLIQYHPSEWQSDYCDEIESYSTISSLKNPKALLWAWRSFWGLLKAISVASSVEAKQRRNPHGEIVATCPSGATFRWTSEK